MVIAVWPTIVACTVGVTRNGDADLFAFGWRQSQLTRACHAGQARHHTESCLYATKKTPLG